MIMKLTEKFIRENFKTFNCKYFNGKLKTPEFRITKAKSYLGQLRYRRSGKGCFGFIIAISDFYDRSEYDYQNTILHEMIHLHIRQNNIDDTRKHHGKIFNEIAQRISSDGWKIATSVKMDQQLKPKHPITCNMVAFIGRNNPCLIRYSTNSKEYFKSVFDKNGITETVWFKSEEYGSFPVCKKRVRGINLTMDEYEKLKALNKN